MNRKFNQILQMDRRKALRGIAMTAVLAMAGTVAMGPASAQTLDQLRANGKIRIGVMVDYPPFGLLNTQGEPDGYDPDVAKALGEHLGLPVEFVHVTGPNRIPYLQTDRADVLVATLAITAERAKQVAFSEPYAGVNMIVYGRKDVPMEKLEDLSGVRLAVGRGSTQDVALTRDAPGDAEIQRYDDDSSAIQALLSGQADATAQSDLMIAEIEKAAPEGVFEQKFRLFQQVQGIAMRLGQDELMAAVNDFLKKAKADGTLNAIHRKWLGADLPDL